MRVIIATLALALAAGGCVSQSKYDALSAELAATSKTLKGEVSKRDATIKELKDQIAAHEAKIKEHETTIAQLKEQIAKLEADGKSKDAQVKELQDHLAALVKDRSRLKQSADELQKALAELNKRKAEADARVAQFKDLLARFKSLIDAGKLKVKIADGRMVLELPTDVLFASGKAKLSDDGLSAITDITKILVTLPSERRFQVEGHTDDQPIKTARYPSNWDLAADRALNVVKAMMAAGVSGQRISAASFGEFRPVASNTTEQGMSQNRRIEIVVVPDLSSLPGFSELQSVIGAK